MFILEIEKNNFKHFLDIIIIKLNGRNDFKMFHKQTQVFIIIASIPST